MKSKKMFVPCVILAVAVLLMTVFCAIYNIALKPQITEKEFAFSITYELDGETVTINDVFTARYDRNDGYTNTKSRVYVGKIGDMGEDELDYLLREDDTGSLFLYTNLRADYLMGDAAYTYNDDELEPRATFFSTENGTYDDEQTLLEQGLKIISWEYPQPIENTFVFSHISLCNNEVVAPALLIGLLAVLAMIIGVKKEENYVRKPVDVISVVLNFLIAFGTIPFFTACGWFIDIAGENEHIMVQIIYFVPALTALGIAASVGLRRKNYAKSALLVTFAGPVVFALDLLIAGLMGIA